MGWNSIYIGTQKTKDFIKNYQENLKSRVIKRVQEGSKFYALMETEDKTQWILLTIAQKRRGEIYLKDIQCNPDESGVPISILKKFIPSNQEDKIWLKQQLEINENIKKVPKFEIGDVVKCTPAYNIRFTDGAIFKKNEDFFLKIEKNLRTNRRQYIIYKIRDNSFYRSIYKIPSKMFKILKKELVKRG